MKINFNELTESVHNLLFGIITMTTMQDSTATVECIHSDDYYSAKGRFIVKDDTITFAFINIKDYDPNDKIFPIKEVTKLARKDHEAIAEVLALFEDCQLNFGYDPTIKFRGASNGK